LLLLLLAAAAACTFHIIQQLGKRLHMQKATQKIYKMPAISFDLVGLCSQLLWGELSCY
jgi:hypothetical protein